MLIPRSFGARIRRISAEVLFLVMVNGESGEYLSIGWEIGSFVY